MKPKELLRFRRMPDLAKTKMQYSIVTKILIFLVIKSVVVLFFPS